MRLTGSRLTDLVAVENFGVAGTVISVDEIALFDANQHKMIQPWAKAGRIEIRRQGKVPLSTELHPLAIQTLQRRVAQDQGKVTVTHLFPT